MRILATFAIATLIGLPQLSADTFDITFVGSDDFDFTMQVANNNGQDLLSILFDLSGTSAIGGGTLIIDPPPSAGNPPGGTSLYFQNSVTSWGFNYTGFNTGETMQFNWDPDIVGGPIYGAVRSELNGAVITVTTALGTSRGVFQDGRASIQSPIPEPTSLLLLGTSLFGLAWRLKKSFS